jgi:hypothetical protein
VLSELQRSDAVIYGMGSLYTSIIPSLILKGVGECIAATPVPKVRQRERRRASADFFSPLPLSLMLLWSQIVCWSLPQTEPAGTGRGQVNATTQIVPPSPLPLLQIFLLNGALDRETSCCPSHGGPMTAADMVQATAGGWVVWGMAMIVVV